MKKEKIFKDGARPGTPMDAALRFLGYSARSVREVERYLDSKQYGEFEISQVIERLEELGLLDDARFAADFVESRLNTKPVSRRHLAEQLRAHELPAEAIERAHAAVDDDAERQNAAAVAQKYWRQLAQLPPRERYERTMRRLLGRGYDWDVARAALGALTDGGMEEELP